MNHVASMPAADKAAITALGPGTGSTRNPAATTAATSSGAGIGNRRRAGVGDQRHRFALGQSVQHGRGPGVLVVLVQAEQRRGTAQVAKQVAAAPGVLGGHERHLPKDPGGAKREVLEVADWRGHDEQRAGHRDGFFIVPLRDARSATPRTGQTIDVAEPFQHFIDDYLGYLYEAHPTSATLDGNHVHDDLLDDLSRTALDSHAGALAGFARRLQAIPTEGLGPVDQVEHRIVRANIESRQFEAETVRSWERDPHYYGQMVAASLAPQALFTFASETDRARRVLSKLRQVPRLVQAARDNVKDPPAIFVKTGIDTFNGVVTFIDADLPRAFAGIDDMHLLADLADASTEATQALSAYAQWLETEVRPRGQGVVPARARTLRAQAGARRGPVPLLRTAAAHRRARAGAHPGRLPHAGRTPRQRRPGRGVARAKDAHPAPGTLIATAREQVAELKTFLARSGVLDVPDGEDVQVAPSPGFLRWSSASLWMPGPFETRRPAATYYLTDVAALLARGTPARAPARPEPTRRCGASRCTRCSPATSSTSSTCARWSRRSAARPCSRRRPTSRAGRTTASR